MKLRFQLVLSTWLCFSMNLHAHFGHNNIREENSEHSSYLRMGVDIFGVCTNAMGAFHSGYDLYTFDAKNPSKILYFIALLDVLDVLGHLTSFVGFSSNLACEIAEEDNEDSILNSSYALGLNGLGLGHHILRMVYKAYNKNKWEKLLHVHNLLETLIHSNNVASYFLNAPSQEDSHRTLKTEN